MCWFNKLNFLKAWYHILIILYKVSYATDAQLMLIEWLKICEAKKNKQEGFG